MSSTPQTAAIAARQFLPAQAVPTVSPLGKGLINDTYLVQEPRNGAFVLQRINTQVFPDPLAITLNYRILLDHLARQSGTTPSLRLPALHQTRTGQDYFRDDTDNVWRAQEYLADTRNIGRVASPAQAAAIGKALGQFHALWVDLPPSSLRDTLPDFHVTPSYLARYDNARTSRVLESSPELEQAFAGVEAGRNRAAVLEQGKINGDLSLRVIHGDPKLDNLLFDSAGTQVISLIDLDTVGAGLPHYDLGDCIRSCCRRDDGTEPFDATLCASLIQAYHTETKRYTSPRERADWYEAIRLIPYELGLRFLTDHLQGDIYFKIDCAGQNLQRALNQFRLVSSIERQEAAIRQCIAGL